MLRASTWLFLLCVSVSSLSACTTTKVQTFTQRPPWQRPRSRVLRSCRFSIPALAPTWLTSIVVSSRRSLPGTSACIVGPAEACGDTGAANPWRCTRNLCVITVRQPLNKGALHQVHDALNVDTILSGSITSVQLDGAPHRPAFTHLTLTYALIGLRHGYFSGILRQLSIRSEPYSTKRRTSRRASPRPKKSSLPIFRHCHKRGGKKTQL